MVQNSGKPWLETTESRAISIVLTLNDRYAQHAAACIASLLRHTDADLDVLLVSVEDPSEFDARFRRSFANRSRVNFEFKRFHLPTDIHFPIVNKLSQDAYIRFWVGELAPTRHRILYVDPDIIAAGPIDALWEIDLQGKALGAVPIPGSTRPVEHGMPPGSPFFNSGVILFDLNAWRSRHYRERCLDYLHRHPERALDADQDILNLCLVGDWLPLDYKWNVINPFYRPSHDLGLPAHEIARIRAEARLIHFNGSKKPWFYMDNHPRKADYFRNLADTDWRGWQPPDRTPANMVRKRVSLLLPEWAKARGRSLLEWAG